MDEKKEEKIVKESQKEEIKTDTEKTERSRNRITKIKQIMFVYFSICFYN